MYKLDEPTTRMITRLFDKMAGVLSLTIYIAHHPPLYLEWQGTVEMAQSRGLILSIGQLQTVVPLSFQTRMTFLVVDLRNDKTGSNAVEAYPITYRDDVNDITDIGARLSGNQVDIFNERIQEYLAVFAGNWFLELETAGYF